MNIQQAAEQYRQTKSNMEQELAAVRTKYQHQMTQHENDKVLQLFLIRKNSVLFEGWEMNEEKKLLEKLDAYGIKYEVQQKGGYTEFYHNIEIQWE